MAKGDAACPLAQRVTSKGHRGCGHRVDHPGEDSLSLELESELGVVRIERRGGTIENLDRLREALGTEKRECQHPGRAGGSRSVRRDVHRPLQMLGPAEETREGLGQFPAPAVIRAGQSGGGGSSSARRRKTAADSGAPFRSGRARGFDQSIDDPTVGGRLAVQQVLGDALGPSRLLSQQSGGLSVGLRTLSARELRIDAAEDDRVDERQRPAGLEDPRRRQQVGRVGRVGLVETRQSRRLKKVALLEHRQRPSEPPDMLRGADRSRSRIDRPTVRPPIRSTWGAASAVGAIPSSLRASTSSRTRNGVPRVARRQASTKSASGAAASLDSTS